MKKISYLLTVVLALAVAACDNTPRELTELMPDKPYLFYSDGCPHCHEAQEFLNRKYPGLNIIKVSIDNKDGARLMSQCVRKFKLGRQVGIPLFCLGDKYIVGWSRRYEQKFHNYIKPFLK